ERFDDFEPLPGRSPAVFFAEQKFDALIAGKLPRLRVLDTMKPDEPAKPGQRPIAASDGRSVRRTDCLSPLKCRSSPGCTCALMTLIACSSLRRHCLPSLCVRGIGHA